MGWVCFFIGHKKLALLNAKYFFCMRCKCFFSLKCINPVHVNRPGG